MQCRKGCNVWKMTDIQKRWNNGNKYAAVTKPLKTASFGDLWKQKTLE